MLWRLLGRVRGVQPNPEIHLLPYPILHSHFSSTNKYFLSLSSTCIVRSISFDASANRVFSNFRNLGSSCTSPCRPFTLSENMEWKSCAAASSGSNSREATFSCFRLSRVATVLDFIVCSCRAREVAIAQCRRSSNSQERVWKNRKKLIDTKILAESARAISFCNTLDRI